MDDDFSRRILLTLDVEDYSSRTDVDQHEVQQALITVLENAAAHAGLDRSRWAVQASGDGELAVLPADVREKRVVDDLPEALALALVAHNSEARTETRLRVRLAVHQGLVRAAAGGYAGTGVVTAARMVDSAAARQALVACPKADLVFLLAPGLYAELVLQRHTRLTPADFVEVPVHTKKFRGTAWLHVPGHDARALTPAPATVAPVPTPADRVPADHAAAVTEHASAPGGHQTTIHGGVRGTDVVIGVQNRFGR